MNTVMPSTGNLYLVVGYDGSAPAIRALDAAAALLRGRTGSINVVYVAHLSTAEMMSADAIAEMEVSFSEIARELQAQAGEQLRGREERWEFEEGQGTITDVLITAGTRCQPTSWPHWRSLVRYWEMPRFVRDEILSSRTVRGLLTQRTGYGLIQPCVKTG